jgi:hypothetical protein
MSEELKPCPFCGETHTYNVRITTITRDEEGNEIQGTPFSAVRLECLRPRYKFDIPVDLYNTRPIEDDLRAEIEILKFQLDNAIVKLITPELEATRKRITELEAERRWIPVGELPVSELDSAGWSKDFQVFRPNARDQIINAHYEQGDGWFTQMYEDRVEVTHYRPLPQLEPQP